MAGPHEHTSRIFASRFTNKQQARWPRYNCRCQKSDAAVAHNKGQNTYIERHIVRLLAGINVVAIVRLLEPRLIMVVIEKQCQMLYIIHGRHSASSVVWMELFKKELIIYGHDNWCQIVCFWLFILLHNRRRVLRPIWSTSALSIRPSHWKEAKLACTDTNRQGCRGRALTALSSPSQTATLLPESSLVSGNTWSLGIGAQRRHTKALFFLALCVAHTCAHRLVGCSADPFLLLFSCVCKIQAAGTAK